MSTKSLYERAAGIIAKVKRDNLETGRELEGFLLRNVLETYSDGYFYEPLTLRTDVDAGGAVTIARRRERDAVIAWLYRAGAHTLAEEIREGAHHNARSTPQDQTLGQDRCV